MRAALASVVALLACGSSPPRREPFAVEDAEVPDELDAGAKVDATRPKPTVPDATPAQPDLPLPPNPFDNTRSLDSTRPSGDARSQQERAADEADGRALEDFDMPLRPGDRRAAPSTRDYEFDEELKRPADFVREDEVPIMIRPTK